ncbi:AraC family transcriptional regulator [Pedobacter roseus]|uniref:AraC family transcriptional regulator n=1 Tax=Pedobacter roseus TaxID=336820 RepID=A0A7G9QJM9_9SPHI|nr:AraC family transcriptional regulator [Pedobacter roseus]QNN43554.1 AraC family transcriptional regulator [Pedobacter roseus]
MANQQVKQIKSISEYHKVRGLPKPEHPLISLIDYADMKHSSAINTVSWVFDFYFIALKKNMNGRFKYGQQEYDFDEGTLFFISPGQVFRIEVTDDAPYKSGWMLLVHPDFLWNFPLANTIKKYAYFSYSVNEALFLSEKEEITLSGIIQNIQLEYQSNIDNFSQQIIISQIEVLLNYAERFYHRQFITRRITNHQVLDQVESFLDRYFDGNAMETGLPTVNDLAAELNLSPDYLSSLLKVTTGQSTQQHIHDKLIERAKEKLSTTTLTISEIAYQLGFGHPQSFSKLFKSKTNLSPIAFRQSFN